MRDFFHYDFIIGIPPRWIDSSVVVLAGPPNDGYSPNINISREQLSFRLTPAEYAATQLVALQQGLAAQKYKVIEEGPTTLGDVDAFQRLHRFEVETDNVRITQLQVYVVKGHEAITITCTNLSEWFDQTKPMFIDAIERFRWRNQQG
jgi:hypothetical protein